MRIRFLRAVVLLFLLAALIFTTQAGRFLVVDAPEKSDVIVVLAGDTGARPAHALKLLSQGMARRAFIDVETFQQVYDQPLTSIAQAYVNRLADPDHVAICPSNGFSTLEETADVARCLRPLAVHRVLIVTSDFHTRRSLRIFRQRLPQYQFSIAAARNPAQFGEAWWTHREWAKTLLNEWMKTIWYEAVDRWR